MHFRYRKIESICLVLFLFFISCKSEKKKAKEGTSDKGEIVFELDIPNGFPEPEIPQDNLLTVDRIELGEKLFFDVLLSRDSSISCGTCHNPNLAFADTVKISAGIYQKKGFRNAPSIFNLAYHKNFMLDGGVPTLEIQVVHPLTDTNEMGLGINAVVERLKKYPYYSRQAKKAYNRELDAFVITRALSTYERTLLSSNSKYDQFISGDTSALNVKEKRGMNLFFSERLNCGNCHSGFLFTNLNFENNGSKSDYTGDKGRERITHQKEDIGKFKVPSLRNVSKTFPYMHDGSIKNLEQVVENYNKGGLGHENQSKLIRKLNLTTSEKDDLIQFLRAL